MPYQYFLWGMRISGLLALIALGWAIFFISPYQNQNQNQESVLALNVAFFEVCLFLAFFAGFSLFLFWLRRWGKKEDLRKNELNSLAGVSLRQGLFLSVLVMALLVMQSFNVLTWWDGLLAMGAILLLEFYFLAR
jgi:hypothetical protein